MSIERCRIEIDAIDLELLHLLNRRAQLALNVGALKIAAGLPICDPKREHDVLSKVCQANNGPLGSQAIVNLFHRIICETRRLEADLNLLEL